MRFLGHFLANFVAVLVIIGVCGGAVFLVGAGMVAVGGWLGEYAVPIGCFVMLSVVIALLITAADLDNPDEEE